MTTVLVVGGQWGDEGKGKIVDHLSAKADHVVRAQGGANAGHTVIVGTNEYKLHLIPSGILHAHCQCYLGSGVVVDADILLDEIAQLESIGVRVRGRLWVSPRAHLIMPYHKALDKLMERRKGGTAIGTTGKGIGPCYADKALRLGFRVGDLFDKKRFAVRLTEVLSLKNQELAQIYQAPPLDFQTVYDLFCGYSDTLAPFVRDVESSLFSAQQSRDHILVEGAQGTFLDINFGTYPFVTSSSTCSAGVCLGAGLPPQLIDHVIMVVKAYCTRVGEGPFPTEDSTVSAASHHVIREVGTTTGRKRRLGWFDAVMARRAGKLNGATSLALTKLDILDSLQTIKFCTGYRIEGELCDEVPWDTDVLAHVEPVYDTVPGWNMPTSNITEYEQLPDKAKDYLTRLAALIGIPIGMISVGPERSQTFVLTPAFADKETV